MKGSLLFTTFLFSSFLISDTYFECKNPEKLGYKNDIYLMKIYDFKKGVFGDTGKVDVTRIIHFNNPELIEIENYIEMEINKYDGVYSIVSDRKFEPHYDFWQILRNLKLEITRRSPYKEFNGKCKTTNSKKYNKSIKDYTEEQKRLENINY
tara:strand:+ start:137 stop:592 length:456 start_codon:yes stop_codon:yes gene_type:complete